MTAEAYARRQKEMLPAIYDEFELIQEGRHESDGPGDGYSLGFRFRDDADEKLVAKTIYLTWGPIVGELLLLCPHAARRDRDRLFSAVEKSFALRSVEFLPRENKGPLLGELPPINSASAPSLPKYPLACVALPTPQGWTAASSENGEIVFSKGGTEIRLQRSLYHGARSDAWSRERLEQLRASGSLILGFEQGQCSRGPYTALLFDERALARTWKTSGDHQTLELFLADQQPLLWILRAPQASFPESRSDLEQLIAATSFLPSAQWETRLAEPWIKTTLRGPWRPEGAGLYLCTSGSPLLLQVDCREKSPSLDKIQSTCNTDAFRKSYGVETVLSASEAKGLWKDRDAFRFSLDGLSADYAPVSLRAGLFLSDRLLYSVVVKGRESRTVDALHLELLEGLRFPAR